MELQSLLYGITLIFALTTALFGVILVNSLFKHRNRFDNKILITFSLFALGYSIFAMGELLWYLIYTVFTELPSESMPDFYWVVGSIFLLLGFTIFSFYLHRQHGNSQKSTFLLIATVGLLGLVSYYLYSINIASVNDSVGKTFLSYYYPIISSLILLASFSVYLFFDKIDVFKTDLLLLFVANIAFLMGDMFYIYYNLSGTYGLVGSISDIMYIAAYFLCTVSLFSLWNKVRSMA